jgi:molybdenum cofactor biosynthesis enzyme MoaA
MWLDTQESKQFLPPPKFSGPVTALPTTAPKAGTCTCRRVISVDDVMVEIESFVQSGMVDHLSSVVLSGEGEPTLRIFHDPRDDFLVQLTARMREHLDVPIQLTTNGLLDLELLQAFFQPSADHASYADLVRSAVQYLQNAGIQSVSVALMTHNANQYQQIMQPAASLLDPAQTAHERVCEFIRQASTLFPVEITAVKRPDVKTKALEKYVQSEFGIPSVRWRSYFP